MHRELTTEEMKEVLAVEALGHLGCTDGERPYIIPMAFSYANGILYGQTTEGKKTDMLRGNPHCCFQIGSSKGFMWRSVLCEGEFEELNFEELNDPESIEAVRALTKRLSVIQDIVGIDIEFSDSNIPKPLKINGKQSTLFRIVITTMSGVGGKSA